MPPRELQGARARPLTVATYRLLALAALSGTGVLLLLPGGLLSGAGDWLAQWWPFAAPSGPTSSLPIDKVVHLALFSLCGLLVLRGWVTTSGDNWPRLFLLLLLFAVFTELAQYLVPGRSTELADVGADAAGAALGISWGLWRRR